MKFTYHQINHFKVNNSGLHSTFTMCNHHHQLFPKHFHPHRKTLNVPSRYSSSPLPPQPLETAVCPLSLRIRLFWTFHINEVTRYVAFGVQLLSLSSMFSRPIHGVASPVLHSLLWLSTIQLRYVQVCHILLIHPSFICWWTFQLFLPFSYCGCSCDGYLRTSIYFDTNFQFFGGINLGAELLDPTLIQCSHPEEP